MFKLMYEYRPETCPAKKRRLGKGSAVSAEGRKDKAYKMAPVERRGVNTDTTLVKMIKANDVNPYKVTYFDNFANDAFI